MNLVGNGVKLSTAIKALGIAKFGLKVALLAGTTARALQGQQDNKSQGRTCPPDCQDEISLPPVSAGDIYANYSRWERILRAVGNWATGFADSLTTIPFTNWSLTRWYRHWSGHEGDADEDSTAYAVGGLTETGAELLILAPFGEAEWKASGWAGRIALDTTPHYFPRLGGRWSHLQLDLWKIGVKGSDIHQRIPLFMKLSRRWKWQRKF
jgi:hypothetical protein